LDAERLRFLNTTYGKTFDMVPWAYGGGSSRRLHNPRENRWVRKRQTLLPGYFAAVLPRLRLLRDEMEERREETPRDIYRRLQGIPPTTGVIVSELRAYHDKPHWEFPVVSRYCQQVGIQNIEEISRSSGFVTMCNIVVPMDIIDVIISFLGFPTPPCSNCHVKSLRCSVCAKAYSQVSISQLLCGLGSCNLDLRLRVLSNWKAPILIDRWNVYRVPLMALNSTKEILIHLGPNRLGYRGTRGIVLQKEFAHVFRNIHKATYMFISVLGSQHVTLRYICTLQKVLLRIKPQSLRQITIHRVVWTTPRHYNGQAYYQVRGGTWDEVEKALNALPWV